MKRKETRNKGAAVVREGWYWYAVAAMPGGSTWAWVALHGSLVLRTGEEKTRPLAEVAASCWLGHYRAQAEESDEVQAETVKPFEVSLSNYARPHDFAVRGGESAPKAPPGTASSDAEPGTE